jgi:hypothetical protein
MLNSVGLQNPGVEAWLEHELPLLLATGARVVASVWGFTVEAYEKAATLLADAPPEVIAVEVNVSCPNVEDRRRMFAHSPRATAEVIEAAAACPARPSTLSRSARSGTATPPSQTRRSSAWVGSRTRATRSNCSSPARAPWRSGPRPSTIPAPPPAWRGTWRAGAGAAASAASTS